MKEGAPDSQTSSAQGATASPPTHIPDHQLLRCIGRGSYGEVWLARSVLGEYRAVKVIHRRAFGDNRPFEREFEGIQRYEPISRSHESQVQILHVGINQAEGYFYYVMELADDVTEEGGKVGKSVSEKPSAGIRPTPTPAHPLSYQPRTLRHDLEKHGRLPVSDCLQIGLALATALAHLHKQRLVHRDIKPSNIIFVKGRPKLADIGLVTDVGDAQSIVGTEGYLPPEGPGAPQADIYALGMVLYEISTGRDRRHFPDLPLDLSPQSAERGTRNAESPLRTPHSTGLLELNEILLKACARDARQRYQSAEEMHADLALLQAGKSVRSKRSMGQLWAFGKKASLAVVLLASVLAAVLAFLHASPRETTNASYGLSKNPDARKEYEEGVHCSRRDTREGLRQGLEHFLKAIEFDPEFTMAYNGLFEVYVSGETLGLSPTEPDAGRRAMAKKMMELDRSLAEAHAAQGWIDFLDWKRDAAERGFQQALELNDQCAIAHMRYGFCLLHWGQVEEGRRHLMRAELLDPKLPRIKKNLGHVFYVNRRFPEAIKQYRAAIDLEPNYPIGHSFIGQALRAQGEYEKAIDEFQIFRMLTGDDAEKVKRQFDELRRAYRESGRKGYWSESLKTVEKSGDLYAQAVCRANMGEYDEAFRLLDAFVAKHQPYMLRFFFDECWDKVRSDSRFIALLKKTGLQK